MNARISSPPFFRPGQIVFPQLATALIGRRSVYGRVRRTEPSCAGDHRAGHVSLVPSLKHAHRLRPEGALPESNEYLAAHLAGTRYLLGNYTTTPRFELEKTIVSTFVATVPLSLVHREGEVNVRFGLISKAPPLNSHYIPDPINVAATRRAGGERSD